MTKRLEEVHFEQPSPWTLYIWADHDKMSREVATQLGEIEGIVFVSERFAGEYPSDVWGVIEFDPRYDVEDLKSQIEAVILAGEGQE